MKKFSKIHCKSIANPLQIHCKSIANPLQIHCKSILIAFLLNLFSFISFSQDQECGTEDPTTIQFVLLNIF
jgi:hypothetical protein